MRSSHWRAGGGLLAVAVGLVLILNQGREPTFQGRPMNEWLRYYPEHSKADREAAVRHFGTNAIPAIMRELMARPNLAWYAKAKLWVASPAPLKEIVGRPRLRLVQGHAAEIFPAIGQSAIPVLVDLLNDENSTVRWLAAQALGGFGDEADHALPQLLKCLKEAPADSQQAKALRSAIQKIDPYSVGRRSLESKQKASR